MKQDTITQLGLSEVNNLIESLERRRSELELNQREKALLDEIHTAIAPILERASSTMTYKIIDGVISLDIYRNDDVSLSFTEQGTPNEKESTSTKDTTYQEELFPSGDSTGDDRIHRKHHTRKSIKYDLLVKFPDGTVFFEKRSGIVLYKTLDKIGFERVIGLNYIRAGENLVTREPRRKGQSVSYNGYHIYGLLNIQSKLYLLRKLNKELKTNLTFKLVER
jgi:hypothetical protein